MLTRNPCTAEFIGRRVTTPGGRASCVASLTVATPNVLNPGPASWVSRGRGLRGASRYRSKLCPRNTPPASDSVPNGVCPRLLRRIGLFASGALGPDVHGCPPQSPMRWCELAAGGPPQAATRGRMGRVGHPRPVPRQIRRGDGDRRPVLLTRSRVLGGCGWVAAG